MYLFMSASRNRALQFWLYLVLLFIISISLVNTAQAEPEDRRSVPPATPITATLVIDHYPKLGAAATLTCNVISILDAPNTLITLELPPEAHLLSGDLSWQGDLMAYQPQTLVASIVFNGKGNMPLFCRAFRTVTSEEQWGDMAGLYLSVGQTEGQAGYAPILETERIQAGELLALGDGQIIEGSNTAGAPPVDVEGDVTLGIIPAETDSAAAIQPPELGQLTVTGRWGYYDRADNYTPALEFIVRLVRGDNGGHLAWCYTTVNGYYSCGPVTNPGAAGVRTLLYSYTNYNPYGDVLATVNPDWGTSNSVNNTFGTQTPVTVFSDGTHDIGSWVSSNGSTYERAYWIQRDLNDTWRFIWFETGSTQNPVETAGPTTVQWKIDSTDGTYYAHGGNIHLTGSDPLSDTVVGHEYGHNIMYTIYGYTLPSIPNCNPHYIQLSSSQGCAWVEGWAEYLPMAVNNDPYYRWDNGASLNLENPTWGTSGWNNGDDVEGRVAGALWDMWDSNNEGDDQYTESAGVINIWDTIYHQNDNTFNQYWSAWLARGHNNSSAGPIMALYQNTISYRTGPANDDFTGAVTVVSTPFSIVNLNTTAATTQGNDPASPCGSIGVPKQSRSVWYRFTPTVTRNYHITTDGSSYDTVLAVWTGSFGSLVNQGCDDDGGVGLNSWLNMTLFAGTTYRIEAMQYDSGVGGLLDLSITQDNTLPTGTIIVNGDDAYTTSPVVNLALSATGSGNGVADMRFRNNDGNWSTWESYSTSKVWTLSAVNGLKTVETEYRDFAGNISSTYSDAIILDDTPPESTASSPISSTDLFFTVTWAGNDNEVGIAYYDVQYRIGATGTWTTWLVTTTDTSAVFGPTIPVSVQRGEMYYFQVRATDLLGNVETYIDGDGDTGTLVDFLKVFLPLTAN